ncbi:MAG: DUF5610 domain-containing protein [Fibromonadaceae bacterium]|jgi:hypothetical protein|nr:DUF5610 domain-containing protein [Fibromonadaceae bacterium]
MDLNTTASVSAAANNYELASKAKGKGTGKHEAPSITPKDTLDISDAGQKSEKIKGKHGEWKNFDMDAFQSGIRNTLMQSINQAKDSLKASGVEFAKYNSDSILYNLSGMGEVKAAEVPEYWNADNTSQRIIDFAMSFRNLAPELSDEEYIEQIRSAVEKGYSLAKNSLGDLPGPSAKLFNDTYELTMKKFDELLLSGRT